jgi:hypothetical protein
MVLPPLLELLDTDSRLDISAYRRHYVSTLVQPSPHTIWDGSAIRFHAGAFEHLFSRSRGSSSSQRTWDPCRLKRMDWILPMLQDPLCDRFTDDRHVDARGRGARCQVIEHSTPFCVILKPVSASELCLITVMCVDKTTKPGYASAYQRIISSDRWK